MGRNSSSYLCCCDGLSCDRFSGDLGFGICYVKTLGGRLKSVCPRFFLKRGVEWVEDLVRKDCWDCLNYPVRR